MQAITVKFFPVTNTKPPRVQASCAARKGPVWSVYDAGNGDFRGAAATAARILIRELGWTGDWVPGDTADGNIVFVCADLSAPINVRA